MGDLSRMAFTGSLLEADAIAGGGLTPAAARLRKYLLIAQSTGVKTVEIEVGLIRDIAVLMERARDTLEAQGDQLAKLLEGKADLLDALRDLARDEFLDDDDPKLGMSRAKARAAIAKATGVTS